MTDTDFSFLLELLCSTEEKAFLAGLWVTPKDEALKGAYSDWLIEHGRDKAAESVRKGYVPGRGWISDYPRPIASGAIHSGYFMRS